MAENVPTMVSIDHGFSFPLRYFEAHGFKPDWPAFLDDYSTEPPVLLGSGLISAAIAGTANTLATATVSRSSRSCKPRYRRRRYPVTLSDGRQRLLASRTPLQRLGPLIVGQLELRTEMDTRSHRPLAPFTGPLTDQIALERGKGG